MSLQQKYFKEHMGILHGRKNTYLSTKPPKSPLPAMSKAMYKVVDSFNYHGHLNMNYYAPTSIIDNYHVVWTCSNST